MEINHLSRDFGRIVEQLSLASRPELWTFKSETFDRAVWELQRKETHARATLLEEFLNFYADSELSANLSRNDRESAERRRGLFKVVFRETTTPLIRAVVMNDLQPGSKPMSLADLARVRHRPETRAFAKLKSNLPGSVIDPLCDLHVFTSQIIVREEEDGKVRIERYEIRMGPALQAFSSLVYKPVRLKQLQTFVSRFGDLFNEEGSLD